MCALTAEQFELLVRDRLVAMGLEVSRVGSGAYQKDGGIDFLAWPRQPALPLILAVQAKHTGDAAHKIGPRFVRDLKGAVSTHGLSAGLLVTNTVFTPDARWFAEQTPYLLGLRDIHDLQRWLRDEYLRAAEWQSIPETIQLCPGVAIALPR
jgi:hypothetical protein